MAWAAREHATKVTGWFGGEGMTKMARARWRGLRRGCGGEVSDMVWRRKRRQKRDPSEASWRAVGDG
jgi:hypothetical protein